MTVIVLPVYRRRIAPVFDFCLKGLVIKFDHGHVVARAEINFEGLSLAERVTALKRADVNTLICGGISDTLLAIVENSDIRVIWGIAGPIKDVISGFISDRLSEPQFAMPGRRYESFKQLCSVNALDRQVTDKGASAKLPKMQRARRH